MNTQSELSRKAREKLSRRNEILAAATRIFAEKGFEKATLDEIAVAAEFGKGTIYNYFSNKEDLFFTLFEEGWKNFHKYVQESLSGAKDPFEKIQHYIEASFEYFRRHEDYFKILSFEIHHPMTLAGQIHNKLKSELQDELQFLARIIQEGIQQDLFVDYDPVLLARALRGLIHSQVFCAIFTQKLNFENSAAIVKRIFLRGISIRVFENNLGIDS